MTATERLRELLDGRVVRWKRVRGHKDNGTSWHDVYGSYVEAVQEYAWDGGEFPEDKMVVRRGPAYMTPEQAIAATLGDTDATPTRQGVAGTCKDVAIEGEWFECSECGTVKQLIHPNYCPNCGRLVVE